MTKIAHISCVIIVKNAEETIQDVLSALNSFNDVVVYDNGSQDETINIAKKFQNVHLIQGNFIGFGPTKNHAATYAKNDWILSLDADEIPSMELITNIEKTKLQKNSVYSIRRTNFYKNNQIKYCWADDEIIRIYNRSITSFTNEHVHEHIVTKELHKKLIKGQVKHYPYSTLEQFINKANTYSTLFAKNNAGKKSSSPAKAFFNGAYSFIKTYFFKQGFRDGYVGLVIAYSHMVTNFYKYIKLYELNKELKDKKPGQH
ncbi:glycosyltransferase family 2 protein [Sulfurimonas sediminis]|uniref:Glycosyltransferase family 2 protein n=1 Tax=Sulfurimonas sediminis TaxID=2590020 RepID=A0A7M1B0U1_9BACT|nr:glycosyltransferase family 2 protein [Sulfurimonas sediminis]QOP43166.1 glycosyltransferase family 2 protein [Sulfurimonas sediminis]